MNNREAFEAWYKKEIDAGECFMRNKDNPEHYLSLNVHFADKCWQAAIAQANEVKQSQTQQPVGQVKHYRNSVDVEWFSVPDDDSLLYLQSQAQQSQWISVEEYEPIDGELVYVFHKTVREVAIAVCETSKHYSRFTSYKFGSEPIAYYTHVSRICAPLPPAPEGEKE